MIQLNELSKIASGKREQLIEKAKEFLQKEYAKERFENFTGYNMSELLVDFTQYALGNVSGNKVALPTDECVEQWWAEGQDQKKGFWQKASYRTNGDVVEDIKKALKYFIETWQR